MDLHKNSVNPKTDPQNIVDYSFFSWINITTREVTEMDQRKRDERRNAMIKKSLFKKITALALATCLATSPAVIYAADDAELVFVEEPETVTTDEASSDEGYAEEVFTEDDITEDVNEEETAVDEPEFVGDDVVEENNEPEFVQEDSVVTEDSANEEVAAAEEPFEKEL